MDDLMNKVSALIEAHVESEVDARNKLGWPPMDEIRRGARALGFWEKLVETLSEGRFEDATFDYVMERIQVMKEWNLNAEDRQKQIEVLCERITAVRAERDEARRTEASFTAQFDAMRKERDEARADAAASSKQAKAFRDIVGIVGAPTYITPHTDLVAMTVDDVRRLREDRDSLVRDGTYAQYQLKELLSALGLTNYTNDKRLVEGALAATRERDARLVAERDDAIASMQSWREKAQALEAKLLEVRKAVNGKGMVGIGDTVRCGHFTGVVTGFRANDGAVVVDHKNDRGNEIRFIQPADLTVIHTAP